MKNPTRRNRNIGTSDQGFGKDNELVIPFPIAVMKSFYERLGEYKTVTKIINDHKFKFVIERTRKNSFHACTIEDIEKIIEQIPKEDYGSLELIILRQPTRKEENLKSVWGRLIYSYEFENEYLPAVIIEAVDISKSLKWSKKLSIDSQKELERLKEDGHNFKIGKRFHEADFEIENIRRTQLYRTLPHEFGHYVHYLNIAERPEIEDEDIEEWEKRFNDYFSLPNSEREVFAHTYADEFKKKIQEKGIIPFDRIMTEQELEQNNLILEDFVKA